jgi:Mg2+-importing ATPase
MLDKRFLTSEPEAVLKLLGTSREGLGASEARARLEKYGKNTVESIKRYGVIVEFLSKFKSPLILLLLGAAIISYFLGEVYDAYIILTIVMFSAVLDFVQEHRASKAAQKLMKSIETTATVLRDGKQIEIRISEIVPGDVILLSPGDIIPADARLIEAKELFIDQSMLTGESFPVEKFASKIKSTENKLEWKNYLFMGSSVTSGTAIAVAVQTGRNTEYADIVTSISKRSATEFEISMRKFGYLILQITFLLTMFVFFVNSMLNQNIFQSFMFAVALGVGLAPELLPMIVSLNLSKGALRMSRHGVIVKRLVSIENFGNMDVLCTDKTGTLTENKIVLVKHMNLAGQENEDIFLYSYVNSMFQTSMANPLDSAIIEHVRDHSGISEKFKRFKKVDEIPFDFDRRRVSVIFSDQQKTIMVTKGAPEHILQVSDRYLLNHVARKIDKEAKSKILELYEKLSYEGYRVLAVAYKAVEKKDVYTRSDESGLCLMGFVAFLDPPKQSVKQCLVEMKNSNLKLKILTGDNEYVTKKICEEINLKIEGILSGEDIDKMNDDALCRAVESNNIFVRVTPRQKTRIISALRKNGHVVGFLGDGINDAPAMRAADVGISVNTGADVAKESADIILLTKNLSVLHTGVLEGRRTFGNTMKYIYMAISSNFGNMLSAAGASMFLRFLPMLPTQILLNNLLYDFSEATIPMDSVDKSYVEKPKKFDLKFIRRFMIVFGIASSLFDFLTFFTLIYVFNASPALFQTAWFFESLCTQTLIIFAIRTRHVPFFKSAPSKALLLSSIFVILSAIAIIHSPLGAFFRFAELPVAIYYMVAVFLILYFIIVEILKIFFFRGREEI